jgi:hypothetical protein
MADDKADGGFWSSIVEFAKAFGLGGVLLISGFVLIGLTIDKATGFTNHQTQTGVLVGGSIAGLLAIVLGIFLPRGGLSSARSSKYDVFLAAPMAGFGSNEADRTTMNVLVGQVNAALGRQAGVKSVHTPILTRPDTKQFEDPAVGFAVELEALRSAKRYLLLLPEVIPAGTSVLMTAGMAIALDIPSVIFAKTNSSLPYLLEGAVESKKANVHLHRYTDFSDIDRLIINNGLRLFTDKG